MKRQMIAGVTALALALSGLTIQPAEAKGKNNDALKLLLGAAAVGLLLSQMNGTQANPRGFLAPTRRPDRSDDDWDDDGRGRITRARLVPGECLMDVRVNGRLREVVSARCLGEMGVASRLPDECAFDIRTAAGRRTVYGPQCLRDYGYRIDAGGY